MHEWHSCYIYVRDGIYQPSFDWVITELAEPIVTSLQRREMTTGHFFARLVEGMPHLRLRLASEADGRQVRSEVEMLLAQCKHPQFLGYDWRAYEPEIERYGGPIAIQNSERFFVTSSDVVSKLVARLADRPRSSRLGSAAVLMLLMCQPFASERTPLHVIFERYADSYFGIEDRALLVTAARECVADTTDSLSVVLRTLVANSRSLGEPFNSFAAGAEVLARHCRDLQAANDLHFSREWLLPTWSILSSQMHMTNNRLGVSRDEECYLANVLALQTRGRQADTATASASD